MFEVIEWGIIILWSLIMAGLSLKHWWYGSDEMFLYNHTLCLYPSILLREWEKKNNDVFTIITTTT